MRRCFAPGNDKLSYVRVCRRCGVLGFFYIPYWSFTNYYLCYLLFTVIPCDVDSEKYVA